MHKFVCKQIRQFVVTNLLIITHDYEPLIGLKSPDYINAKTDTCLIVTCLIRHSALFTTFFILQIFAYVFLHS